MYLVLSFLICNYFKSISQGTIRINEKLYKTENIQGKPRMIENFVIKNTKEIISDISKDPCPIGWRIPSLEDYRELHNLTYKIKGYHYYEKCNTCNASGYVPKKVNITCPKCKNWDNFERYKVTRNKKISETESISYTGCYDCKDTRVVGQKTVNEKCYECNGKKKHKRWEPEKNEKHLNSFKLSSYNSYLGVEDNGRIGLILNLKQRGDLTYATYPETRNLAMGFAGFEYDFFTNNDETHLKITRVIKNSPASKSGLKEGDIIIGSITKNS